MSLTNQSDPEIRPRVVEQRLANVLHPPNVFHFIVQHLAVEQKQMVVTSAPAPPSWKATAQAISTPWRASGACKSIMAARIWRRSPPSGCRPWPVTPSTGVNRTAAQLAEQLDALKGGDDDSYFVNFGSEANEAGFKIAPQYAKHGFPGEIRFQTLSRYCAYHATTVATLAVGGMSDHNAKAETFASGFIHVPAPTRYRCPLALEYPSWKVACATAIETTALGEGLQSVAEISVEPIMAGIGMALGPDEHPPMVEVICSKDDPLLQVVEAINSFGSTGRMSATSITA